MSLEIEKKYYVNDLPNLNGYDWYKIIQTYLGISESEELRIRKTELDGKRIKSLTHKKGSGEVREETTIKIDYGLYRSLLLSTNKKSLVKHRYIIPYNNLTIELDIYLSNRLQPVAEIEFANEIEMQEFEPPSWFGEECNGSNSDFFNLVNMEFYDDNDVEIDIGDYAIDSYNIADGADWRGDRYDAVYIEDIDELMNLFHGYDSDGKCVEKITEEKYKELTSNE